MAKNKKISNADFAELDAKAPEGKKYSDIKYAWENCGQLPDGEILPLKDALAMHEASVFIPKIINNVLREAVEPYLIGTSLLTKIPYVVGTQIELPVAGAIDGEYEVGEEESFPEFRVTFGGGTQISATGKQGLALRFTEEVLRYSSYPVIDLHLRQAAKALARSKEEKIFRMWSAVGHRTHSNSAPLDSEYGTTSGRDMTGAMNGSFTLDNLMEMIVKGMSNGVNPDLMMVHPLTWLMFLQDAQLRLFAQEAKSAWFGSQWSGDPSATNTFTSFHGGQGLPGSANRTPAFNNLQPATAASEYNPQMKSAPVIPGYFGMPLRIITSPFVPFDAANKTTNIILMDSSKAGFYIEDHGLMTEEWKNPETDILKIKMKERYLIRPADRGHGILVAEDVSIKANQIILPAQATINVAGSIPAEVRNVAIN